MNTTWIIVTRAGDRIENLTEDQVRELLYRRKIQPEDWAMESSPAEHFNQPAADHGQLRQIALIDPFAGVASTARRRRRKKQDGDPGMDMTPMIDVVFLLLIFFMITATFHLQTGLGFPPDKQKDSPSTNAPAPGLSEFDDRVIIEVNEKDEFFVKSVGGTSQPVAVADLVAAIRSEGESSKLNKAFVVAHEMASLEAIVKAFDAAAEVGISDVALADVTTAPSGGASGGASGGNNQPLQIQRN
ncbi:ExbD/TolR family protein [Stieleria varia]|uniref:Colicin uptake protein TolR n=1 Tax=Stieleria varia TaxID=2528005 RepID=A0A5C6B172_9BACT|nr:biopolymer transporter ExbD [Stieleria varia]TWU05618.1 colicin uptake protein TolR [Stieleria varia]